VKRSLCLIGFLALPMLGCAVGAVELSPSDTAVNRCDDNSPCAVGRCLNGICNGSQGTLTSLLVSVSPSITQPGVANLTYFQTLPTDGSGALGSGGGTQNLKLDPALDLRNTVSIDISDNCVPAFDGGDLVGTVVTAVTTNAIPCSLTFTPSLHPLGIATDAYTTKLDKGHYLFLTSLPPGDYDVYITPAYPVVPSLESGGKLCDVPPRLLLNQSVRSNIGFKLPPPSTLKIEVTWPLGPAVLDPEVLDPLWGWTIDLVDPNSGRVLSTVKNLASPVPVQDPANPMSVDPASVVYGLALSHAPIYATDKGVLVPQNIGSELIRLKPPAFHVDSYGTPTTIPYTAPIFYAQLDGALVDPSGKSDVARVVQDQPLPAPVTVEFQTTLGSSPDPVPAGVTFTATALDGITSLPTRFVRTVQVDEKGLGQVELMPGRYRVNGLAKGGCTLDSCPSATEVDWLVRPGTLTQAGKVIQFWPASQLVGRALVPSGDPAIGARVRALASTATFDSNVLNLGDGAAPILPRAGGGVVGQDGQFSFDADPGIFDFSVEPDPSTGFGWFVHPRLVVPDDSERLDSVVLEMPIVYRGAATFETQDTSTPIPGALVRAYVYLKPDGTLTPKPVAGSVAVQVAETQADEAGGFVLLIPPHLDGN